MPATAIWQKIDEWSADRTIQALVVVLAIFIAFKGLFVTPRFSDGNIYLYLGYLIRHGAVPYRDFFYSSPPLLPYLSTIWGSIFGFTWQGFGWLPIVTTVGEAILLYTVSRKVSSAWAGVISVVVYLFSFAVLASTDFATDVHIVALLCLAGLYALVKDKPGWAGFWIALACLTKIYGGIIVLSFVVWYIWQRKWPSLSWFVGIFVIVFGGINAVAWLLVGHTYLQYVVLNNLHRQVGISKWSIWKFFLLHDIPLLIGVLPCLWLWRRWSSLLLISTVILTAFFVLYPDIYYLYLKLLGVWLALWVGWGCWQLCSTWPTKWVKSAIGLFLVISVGTAGWLYTTQQSRMAVITDLDTMVKYVAATVSPEQTVYGDFSVAPLIARTADRQIVNNLVDTNVKFFKEGMFTYENRARELAQAKVPLLITVGYFDPKTGGLALNGGSVSEEMLQSCRVDRLFPISENYDANAVIMWTCSY